MTPNISNLCTQIRALSNHNSFQAIEVVLSPRRVQNRTLRNSWLSMHLYWTSIHQWRTHASGHCLRHLVVSSQDLPHPHYFSTSTRIPVHVYWRSWTFICIKNHITCLYQPIPRPTPYFFYPGRLGFLSHLE